MKTFSVLLLDGSKENEKSELARKLKVLDDRRAITVTDEFMLGSRDIWEATDAVLAEIKRATGSQLFDLIIIGNNLGYGFPRAQKINEKSIKNTIVVSNGILEEAAKGSYERLGITRFSTRAALARDIETILGLNTAS